MANKIDPAFTTVPPTTIPTDNLLPDGVKCNGNAISRIVNGDDAKKNSWPWIVGVRMGGYMCGGSIISPDYVMTAAHCCDGFRVRVRTVHLFYFSYQSQNFNTFS